MTREEELNRLIAKAQKVGELALADDTHHLVAMKALLSAFATIAKAHPCCTAAAARLAKAVAFNLQQHADTCFPPASQRVH